MNVYYRKKQNLKNLGQVLSVDSTRRQLDFSPVEAHAERNQELGLGLQHANVRAPPRVPDPAIMAS